jgi:putative PEP-CTERM system histidine kinase
MELIVIPIFHYIGAVLALTLAVIAVVRDWKAFAHQVFAFGMFLLAWEAVFFGLSSQALLMENAAAWQIWRLRAAALVPGTWLVFSLIFVRPDRRLLRTGFKWLIAAIIFLHLVFLLPLNNGLFSGEAQRFGHSWAIELSALGYGFFVAALLSLILVLVLLEKALRASVGHKRWQVKFLVLGVGSVIAAHLIAASYTLVYWRLDPRFEAINSIALILAFPLIAVAMRRAESLQLDIYFSQKAIFNSLTLIITGLFFLALGLATSLLKGTFTFPVRSLIIFAAMLALLVLMLSDRLRIRLKSFISKQLHGGRHDYREIWLGFTQRTNNIMEVRPLCETVAGMISELFDALAVSIWLFDDLDHSAKCKGSTIHSPLIDSCQSMTSEQAKAIEAQLKASDAVVDLNFPNSFVERNFAQKHAALFEQNRLRYLVPMTVDQELLGYFAIGDRIGHHPLTLEDKNILVTIGQQVAASLKKIQMARLLHQGQELEAFQTMSAFFVHDLKNLAARLSLLFQNFPGNFDDPEFRKDAIRVMRKSVHKIDGICSRLSILREKLEVKFEKSDLNQVVEVAMAGIGPSLNGQLDIRPGALPEVMLDPEQIKKVITNLVLNAQDAVGRNGGICVSSSRRNGWIELCVSDDGCGMSRAFMEQSLFKPFKTTKKQGTENHQETGDRHRSFSEQDDRRSAWGQDRSRER